jgi:hypothetical protein
MNKKLSFLITSLASALLLVGGGVGCGSSVGGTGTGGSTGNGGAGGGVPPGYIALPSSSSGFVQDVTGGSNVIGPWYSYGDGVGKNASVANGPDATNSDCQLKGGFPASACSQIAFPPPGMPFPPSDLATSKMCTDGVAAMVMNKAGAADYTDLWGAGISLDLNNPGGDAGVKGDLDLSAYKGVSFDFSAFTGADPLGGTSNGMGAPPASMRVNFPFTGEHVTDSPFWMGATKASSPLTPTPMHVEVLWTDVGGPFYLSQQSPVVVPPPFDPKHVQSIQFQVFTSADGTKPYAFCVANLALIPNK